MDTDIVVDALRAMYWLILQLVGPAVLPAMAVGLVVGLLQAASSVSESTLSFIPKLLATILTLVFWGAMMLRMLSDFTVGMYGLIPDLLH